MLLWLDFPVADLASRQREFKFKMLSGAALWAYIGFQWLLALARVRGWHRTSKLLFVLHLSLGIFGPVLLYVHAARWGFGFLNVLSGLFLFNHALGLVQPRTASRSKPLKSAWLVVHIALSVVLVALAGYHTWQGFYYE